MAQRARFEQEKESARDVCRINTAKLLLCVKEIVKRYLKAKQFQHNKNSRYS